MIQIPPASSQKNNLAPDELQAKSLQRASAGQCPSVKEQQCIKLEIVNKCVPDGAELIEGIFCKVWCHLCCKKQVAVVAKTKNGALSMAHSNQVVWLASEVCWRCA